MAPIVNRSEAPSRNRTGMVWPSRQPSSSAVRSPTAIWSSRRSVSEPSVTPRSRTWSTRRVSVYDTPRFSPSTMAAPPPRPTAASTSGSRPTATAICGSMPAPPNAGAAATRSPPKVRSMASSRYVFTEAANTVNTTTTPTPTSRADAVADVRRGLRMALRRASTPPIPGGRATGRPRTAAAGRAITGPTITTPARQATAPSPAKATTESPPMATAASTAPMPAPGADGPQQGHLPGPLGDDDRERVVDAERGDQQGDAGEHGQERPQHAQELAVDLVDPVLRPLVAGQRLGTPGDEGLDAGGELVLRDARVGLDQDAADPVGAARDVALGRVQREPDERGLAEPVGVTERGDAHDLHPQRPRDLHGGGVAHAQVGVLGRAPVDHDLVVGLGRAALDQLVRVQVGVLDPAAGQAGRSVAADRLGVRADDRPVALDRGLGHGHAVDGPDAVDQGGVDLAALLDVVAAAGDRGRVADHDVGAGGGLREQVVEVAAQRVAEHECPGQERHAQEHGQRGAEQAALVAPGALEADLQHRFTLPSARSGPFPGTSGGRGRWPPWGRASRPRSGRR